MTAIIHDPINQFLFAALVVVYWMAPSKERWPMLLDFLKLSPLLAAGCAWAYWLGMNR